MSAYEYMHTYTRLCKAANGTARSEQGAQRCNRQFTSTTLAGSTVTNPAAPCCARANQASKLGEGNEGRWTRRERKDGCCTRAFSGGSLPLLLNAHLASGLYLTCLRLTPRTRVQRALRAEIVEYARHGEFVSPRNSLGNPQVRRQISHCYRV